MCLLIAINFYWSWACNLQFLHELFYPWYFTKTMSHRLEFNLCIALLATTFCFLLLHVTKFPPTKVQYPDVDLRSFILHVQLASVQASTCICPLFLNINPFRGVLFKYLTILKTTLKWVGLSACINWLITLTTNVISSAADFSFTLGSIGVVAALHPVVPVSVSKSSITSAD